jgi:deoxyribose-phosphate aldolase
MIIQAFNFQQIMHCADLTCLKDSVIPQDIEDLVEKGMQHQVAALCVWPTQLNWIPKSWNIQKATVVNFPNGNQATKEVMQHIDDILLQHPYTEIDAVFPYQTYLNGMEQKARSFIPAIAEHCLNHGVKLKLILETGALNTAQIENLALESIDCGVGMLKTSTGKITIGATIPAVEALCKAIKKRTSTCGIKISGGVRTKTQAESFIQCVMMNLDKTPDPSWFRIGCSQLNDE